MRNIHRLRLFKIHHGIGLYTGSGTGYTLQGVVERRITPDWFIGVGVDIQQAKDYTPSHG
ncbi:BCSC C-terminal domain-containing protein, partial [Pantoea agglomerans]|nr:BCSC C-terminal domain-containing protein [Pantoea agglomerans]